MTGSDDSLELSLPWGRTPPTARPALTRDEPKPPPPPPAAEVAVEPPRPEPSARPDPGDLELGLGRLRAISARLARLEEQAGARETGFEARLTGLEEQAAAREAGLQARFDELERLLEANRAASAEAVGLLAGHLVARLEDQAVAMEAARLAQQADLEVQALARHDEVLARVDEASRAMIDATAELASRQLVTQLLDGIVVTGEVLEAEMIELRRVVEDYTGRPAEPVPVDRSSPVDVESPVDVGGTVDGSGPVDLESTVERLGTLERESSS